MKSPAAHALKTFLADAARTARRQQIAHSVRLFGLPVPEDELKAIYLSAKEIWCR